LHRRSTRNRNRGPDRSSSGGGDIPQPPGDEPQRPAPSASPPDATLSPEEAKYIDELRNDRIQYRSLYIGIGKEARRAQVKALAPDHPDRLAYEYLKARVNVLHLWDRHRRLPPPELDPGHPLHKLRTALRNELARLPRRQQRALWQEFNKRFGSKRQATRAERARVAALPLDHPERLRYERLYAASRLMHAQITSERRTVAQLKRQRDEYERRFLGKPNATTREQLERGEGSTRAKQKYAQLKRAYEQWEASYSGAYDEEGRRLRTPNKPLPPDIPAAMAALKPSLKEWRRLKLGYKAKAEAYLAGDDKLHTRLQNYLKLKADAFEYLRLERLLKQGYTGGESLPPPLGEWGGPDSELSGDDLALPAEGGPVPFAGATPEMPNEDTGGSNAKENDRRLFRADNVLARNGLPSAHEMWQGLLLPLSTAAQRMRSAGRDFMRDNIAKSFPPPVRAPAEALKIPGVLHP
jgi:hypothetical protein